MVAVHNQALAEHLRAQFPAAEIDVIPMGVRAVSGNAGVRARHGIPQNAIVFGCYGKVIAAKRIEPMLGALARVARQHPSAHLLIAGDASPEFDVERAAAERGIAGNVTIAGYVDDEALDGYLQAADVCVCLRWPSTGETSASWLRCLAAGKATIITNLVQLSDVPRLEERVGLLDGTPHPGTDGRQLCRSNKKGDGTADSEKARTSPPSRDRCNGAGETSHERAWGRLPFLVSRPSGA